MNNLLRFQFKYVFSQRRRIYFKEPTCLITFIDTNGYVLHERCNCVKFSTFAKQRLLLRLAWNKRNQLYNMTEFSLHHDSFRCYCIIYYLCFSLGIWELDREKVSSDDWLNFKRYINKSHLFQMVLLNTHSPCHCSERVVTGISSFINWPS